MALFSSWMDSKPAALLRILQYIWARVSGKLVEYFAGDDRREKF